MWTKPYYQLTETERWWLTAAGMSFEELPSELVGMENVSIELRINGVDVDFGKLIKYVEARQVAFIEDKMQAVNIRQRAIRETAELMRNSLVNLINDDEETLLRAGLDHVEK